MTLAIPGAAKVIVPERVTGNYYPAGPWGIRAGSNGTITLDKLFCLSFYVGEPQTFDQIAVTALVTSGGLMRLGIYADDDGKPGALVGDYGQANMANGGLETKTISETLSGLVWLAGAGQGVSPATSRLRDLVMNPWVGTTDPYAVNFGGTAYSQNSVSGALPDPWGATYNVETGTNEIPMIWLRTS